MSNQINDIYSYEDFSNIAVCGGPVWHPSRNILYFISNMNNFYQIYQTEIIKKKTSDRKRITSTKDRTTVPMVSKTGKLYFLTDLGGNENWQINEMNPETKITTPITSMLDRKHQLSIITENQLIFTGNRNDKSRFDIFSYSLNKKEISLIHESKSEGMLSVESITEDEMFFLVSERFSINKTQFYVYNVTTNSLDLIRLTSEGSWLDGKFLTASSILCLTEKDREFHSLALIDIDKQTFSYLEEDNWDTEYFLYDDKSNRLVWVKNVEGYSKLFIARLKNGKLEDKKEIFLPEKSVITAGDSRSYLQPLAFNYDATMLAFCLDSSIMNQNVWVIELENDNNFWNTTNLDTGKVSQDVFVSEELHKIKSFDGLEFSSYIYKPKISTNEKAPCIIMIHGGPEGQVRPDFNPLAQFFLYKGFAVALPNVRGSSGYGRTFNTLDNVRLRLNSVKDIASLVNYLGTIPTINQSKIAVYGGSYGGYMVLGCITEYPELFAAGIDVVGISNFVTFLEHTANWRRKLREVEYGSLEHDRDFLETISPIHKAGNITSPLLIVHGKNDERVPLSETNQMYETLQKNSVPVELLVFEDEGHGVVKTKNKAVLYKRIIEFLEKYLK